MFRGNVFINIELKGPRTEEIKSRYSPKNAAEAVHALVVKHNMHGKFLISSFTAEILKAVEDVRQQHESTHPRFDIIYLYNFENLPLPAPEVYTAFGDGINISANHLTEEVVENCKRNHKKIGVWIRAADFVENEDFYIRAFKMGVNFICADKPHDAMETRKRHFKVVSL